MKAKSSLITMIAGILCVLVLVLAACAPKAAPPAPAKGPIKLGYISDLTGPTGLSGQWFARLYDDYSQYLNAKGGIRGHPVEFKYIDAGNQPPRVITAYKSLKEWGALVIGNQGTPEALAVKDMHAADKVPGVTNSMTAAAVYPPAYLYVHYDWVVHGAFLGLKWLLENKWDYDKQGPMRIGIIGIEHPMSRFNGPCIRKYADKLGGGKIQTVAEEYMPLPPVTAEPQVRRFKDTGVHWIINNMPSDTFTAIAAKDAMRLGLKFNWMHQTSGLLRTTMPVSEGSLEGHYHCSMWGQPEDKGWGIDLVKELWTTYQKKPLEEMYGKTWEAYAGHGFHQYYLMQKAVEMALEAVGYDKLTPEAVKVNGFDKMKDVDTGGISAGVSYVDYPGDRIGVSKSRILQVKGMRFIKVTDWMLHVPESNNTKLLVEEWSK